VRSLCENFSREEPKDLHFNRLVLTDVMEEPIRKQSQKQRDERDAYGGDPSERPQRF
jgi:hypothetical protein